MFKLSVQIDKALPHKGPSNVNNLTIQFKLIPSVVHPLLPSYRRQCYIWLQ